MTKYTTDISIRLDEKKHLKTKLKLIAKKNGMNLNQLMVLVIEWYLDREKDEVFTIKMK